MRQSAFAEYYSAKRRADFWNEQRSLTDKIFKGRETRYDAISVLRHQAEQDEAFAQQYKNLVEKEIEISNERR